MKKQYLHLSVYFCDKCEGPVVSGSVAVRENEISKETDVREIGAICLSCGHRQSKPALPVNSRVNGNQLAPSILLRSRRASNWVESHETERLPAEFV
jgi:hypothetical protein